MWGGPPGPQPTPWSASSMRFPRRWGNHSSMTFYRRRLPHLYDAEHPVFLTWRLHGSLPPNRVFPSKALTSGEAFAAMYRLLDEAREGTFHLRQPEIADMVAEGIHYNADVLHH